MFADTQTSRTSNCDGLNQRRVLMPHRPSKRVPISQAHVLLGRALYQRRDAAGASVRDVPGFSHGHLSNVENGHVTPSERLVETYIYLYGGGSEIRALYEQMRRTTARKRQQQRDQRLRPQVTQVSAPQSLRDVYSPEDVSKHYVTEIHQADCSYDDHGAIKQLKSTVWVRAQTSQVKLFYAGALYDAERRTGVLRAEALEGLTLLTQEENEVGAIKAFFELAEVLEPEDPDAYKAAYVMKVSSTKQALPQLVFYSRPGTVRLDLRATFNTAMHPKQLWTFGAPNMVNIRHRLEDELHPDRNFNYSFSFSPTIPGWCYGFSWLW